MSRIIKTTINGRTVYYDVLSSCIAENLSSLKEYVKKNTLELGIDIPPIEQDEIQGFFFVLTTKCNLNCRYCYSVSQNEPLSMTKDDPARIIQKYLRNEVKYILVNFFGGEPTLEMDIIRNTVKYLKTLHGKKVYLRIATNGLVPKEHLDFLISNKFHITVSNDGVLNKDSSLDKVRHADIVEETIRYLVKCNAIFSIRYTATSANYLDMPRSVQYWQSLGVPLAHIEPYHPTGNSEVEMGLLPNVNDYVKSFMNAIDEAEKVGLKITTGAYMNLMTPSSYFCSGASGRFCVYNPDGSISTCYRVQSFQSKYKKFIIGNWKTDDVNLLWTNNKSKLNKHTVVEMKSCNDCENSHLCSGGCLMRNLTQTGNMNIPDKWSCTMKHKLLKDAIVRIWNSLSQEKIPVILGRFIFENYLIKNPSISLAPTYAKDIIPADIQSENGVFDLYKCLGICRNDEYAVFNNKIARTECL